MAQFPYPGAQPVTVKSTGCDPLRDRVALRHKGVNLALLAFRCCHSLILQYRVLLLFVQVLRSTISDGLQVM